MIANFNSASSIQMNLINLIYEEDTIIDSIIDFLLYTMKMDETQITQSKKNYSSLCTDTLLKLVNYTNSSQVNIEFSAVRNMKDFLLKMSEKIPRVFYNNLSCFIKLLDNEAYHIRNAVVEIISNIIKNLLSSNIELGVEQEESHIKAKEKLIESLF